MEESGAEALAALGFSRNEVAVYLQLCGGALSVEMLAKATGIHRRSVYDALSSLQRRGLVRGVLAGGKRLFSSTGAHSLADSVDDCKVRAVGLAERIERGSEKLKAPAVSISVGKNGIKSVLADVVREGKPFYNYGGAGYVSRFLKNFYPQWEARMRKARVPLKCIFTDVPEARIYAKAASQSYSCEARFIPAKYFSYAVWWLYADKVVLVFWREEPFAVVIEDGELAKTYRNFFSLMWRQAKR